MRRAAKVDANQAEIVKALRDTGCGVLDLSGVGKGCPDLLVHAPFYPWRTTLLEIKDGAKPPSARKLTADQERFHATWKGFIHVVTTADEALDAAGVSRR
jgi:hypothetical protein